MLLLSRGSTPAARNQRATELGDKGLGNKGSFVGVPVLERISRMDPAERAERAEPGEPADPL